MEFDSDKFSLLIESFKDGLNRYNEEIEQIQKSFKITTNALVFFVLPALAAASIFILVSFGTENFTKFEMDNNWKIAWLLICPLFVYTISFPFLIGYLCNVYGLFYETQRKQKRKTVITKKFRDLQCDSEFVNEINKKSDLNLSVDKPWNDDDIVKICGFLNQQCEQELRHLRKKSQSKG